MVCSLGCDRQPHKNVNVAAPGVKVDIEKNKGVASYAPGVHVDTAAADGPGVKAEVDQSK